MPQARAWTLDWHQKAGPHAHWLPPTGLASAKRRKMSFVNYHPKCGNGGNIIYRGDLNNTGISGIALVEFYFA